MRKPIAGVMGPGEQATLSEQDTAYLLGQKIAEQGWVLLTGGRNEGVMDAASRGAKQVNGLTVGILPGSDLTNVSTAVDIPILTGMGSARNNINVLSCNVIFVCGMGRGTASEVALALKANKQVILLNSDPTSQAFFKNLATDRLWTATTPDEAVAIAQKILAQQF
ncbi:MAG: TIGR00725 family protein [Elainellaceae cyanobacterium]